MLGKAKFVCRLKLGPCISTSAELSSNEFWAFISETELKLLEENIGGIPHHLDLSIVC